MSRTALFLVAASVLGFISLGPSRKPPAVAPPIAKPGSSNGLLEVTAIATHGLVPAGGGEVTAQIDVRLREAATARAKVSISLVIDRSGSMVGEKLESAKRAARAFVERLEPTDQLALVSFSSDVTRLHLRTMNAEGKRVALGVIDELQPGGGTNIGDALRAGADELAEATGNRRLVLASDGNPTVGVVASDELMRVAESIHEQAIGVTALGIGADYNASLMIGLAELGGGFYGYLSEAGRLDEVLAQELSQARATLARNVKLTLKPGAGVTVTEVPGRVLLGSQLRLPDFKQGDTARLFVRLQVAPGAVVSARELLAVEVSDVAVSSGVRRSGSG